MDCVIEHMYEKMVSGLGNLRRHLVRTYEPPRKVWVRLEQVFASGLGGGKQSPAIARSRGLRLRPRVPGLQHAWVRTTNGAWMAVVSFSLVADAVGEINLRYLLRAEMIEPHRRIRAPGCLVRQMCRHVRVNGGGIESRIAPAVTRRRWRGSSQCCARTP
ncbi:hypothetical protein GCM10009765_23470 [Fodinicola feengrottensis]|uniref:Uncharacterized protein n=1 Tax=Fodinicola feengrottensis TaxID=435914 RepID=A0ABN2GM18_9ACTN